MDREYEVRSMRRGAAYPELTIKSSRNDLHQIRVCADANQLSVLRAGGLSDCEADLFDLAAHVYAADKIAVSRIDEGVGIYLSLELREPSVFREAAAQLSSLLYWLTDFQWHFDFRQINKHRVAEQLPLQEPPRVENAVLLSGGLDSLAGLCSILRSETDVSTCSVALGSNMRRLQQDSVRALADEYHGFRSIVVPVRPQYLTRTPDHAKNNMLRSRGFLFLVLGALAARLLRASSLLVCENGVGAINLPFLSSATATDHSRAVHPATMKRVERFVEMVLGTAPSITNPNIFQTKAQMCGYLPRASASWLAAQTNSCDSRPRRPSVQSCGFCSSCLLRRQALHASGVRDLTVYADGAANRNHLQALTAQAKILGECASSSTPWASMVTQFPDLLEARDALASGSKSAGVQDRLVRLYSDFAREWASIGHVLEDISA